MLIAAASLVALSCALSMFYVMHQIRLTIGHVESAQLLERLDRLDRAFWFFGSLLVASGVMLSLLLLRTTRRMARFNASARHAELQLSRALDDLNCGDNERRAQNRFIAAASHDLRQPVHALGLYLTALRTHVTTSDGQAILDSTDRSTEALTQLLNSLLDISRLDAGVVDIHEQPFALDELLQQLHRTFLPVAEQRGLTLLMPASGLWVDTDRTLLDRILRNLINNALNYTSRGSVTVDAGAGDAAVSIRVTDTGLGIPAIEQQAVFTEYYQLHNPERDRAKGLGLGLSIVRRLTRLLDIELAIQSEEGRGTRFELQVPASAAAPQPDHATAPAAPNTDAGAMAGLSIMVIDDERDVREGMQLLLGAEGCEVLTAEGAGAAVTLLSDHDLVPDLIIADYRLRDEQTGSDAIACVREELNKDVPAMIVTGDTSPDRLKEATGSGFCLLHKPVATQELFATIRQLVNR